MGWSRSSTSLGWMLTSLVLAGCAKTPQQKLIGKWKGAPDVSEEVSKFIKEATASQEIPPEAMEVNEKFAQFAGKAAARMGMGMDLHLASGGAASFKGHTESFGLVGDVNGTWEVIPKESGDVILRMGTKDKQVEGKVVWRDSDAFFFQFEAPLDAPTEIRSSTAASEEEKEDAPKTKTVTMLFRRKLVDY